MENSLKLHVSLVQADTRYETISGNLAHIEELIESIQEPTDVILLPELFNTGYKMAFTTRPEVMGLQTTNWMKNMARRRQSAICGSISIAENGKTFNRMLFVSPDGSIQHYDKINVFKFSGEDKIFAAGSNPAVFEYKGWRLKATICFDLRFPEVIRNEKPWYDVILCAAHWPEQRMPAWDVLLQARAIENQAFVAAVNRFGQEGETNYTGHSVGIDYLGQVTTKPMDSEGIISLSFDKNDLNSFRGKFPFLEN